MQFLLPFRCCLTIFSIIIVITLISCLKNQNNKFLKIYSDTTGMNITTRVPADWIKYKIPDFSNKETILFSIYGNVDTTSYVIIEINRIEQSGNQSLDTLLKEQIVFIQEADTGVHVIRKGYKSGKNKEKLAYFDCFTGDNKNRIYRETLIISKGDEVGSITIFNKKNEVAFNEIVNLLSKNLEY